MESFSISKDLITKEEITKYGNIKFFKKGRCNFNTKTIGLYLTLLTIIGSNVIFSILMYINFT